MGKNINAEKINSVLQIPIEMIVSNPNQPRKVFNERDLMELAHSIYQNGIIQPLSVRLNSDNKYELIAGERRLKASQIAGLKSVPCILIDASEKESALFALIENIQRRDLDFFEEALGIQKLIEEYGLSQEETAKKLGKAQSTLSNKMRLLKLPSDIREKVMKYGLTERHARALLKLDSAQLQERAVDLIIEKRLNVSQTELMIENMLAPPQKKKKILRLFKDVRIFINTLNHAVDTMRQSGIMANAEKTESENYIEYIVKIPKPQYSREYKDKKSAG